jgi:hypothetical protein
MRLFDTAARWKTDRKEYLLMLVKVGMQMRMPSRLRVRRRCCHRLPL